MLTSVFRTWPKKQINHDFFCGGYATVTHINLDHFCRI